MTRTRTPSDMYRTRTIDEWTAAVAAMGATSLTSWATTSRTSYNAARVLGVHRQIASALGWKCKLPNGTLDTLPSDTFAKLFAERGAKTPSDMWSINNAWCKVLKRQGRFDDVRQLIEVEYVARRHIPTLAYFLEQSSRFEFFEAWTCADRVAAQTARRLGLLDAVRIRTGRRPKEFETSGGPVRSVAVLVVARFRDQNCIPFVVQPAYPFKTLGARVHAQRADFLLCGKFWVEVWMHTLHDSKLWLRTSRYLFRRRQKMERCKRYGLCLVNIEGALLHRAGLAVFVEHCRLALEYTSTLMKADIEPRKLLSL